MEYSELAKIKLKMCNGECIISVKADLELSCALFKK